LISIGTNLHPNIFCAESNIVAREKTGTITLFIHLSFLSLNRGGQLQEPLHLLAKECSKHSSTFCCVLYLDKLALIDQPNRTRKRKKKFTQPEKVKKKNSIDDKP